MTKTEQVQLMTEKMAKFVAIVGKKLPDDVEAKLAELRAKETTPLAQAIYETMAKTSSSPWSLTAPAVRTPAFCSSGSSAAHISRSSASWKRF